MKRARPQREVVARAGPRREMVGRARSALELAASVGAHVTVVAGDDAATEIRAATGGLGADVVLDVVGSDVSEVSLQTTYWGSVVELVEVLDLARRGAIRAEDTTFPLGDALAAYAALRSGSLPGRAVLVT